MRCGKKKVWLDPNEINEIANTNSRRFHSFFWSIKVSYLTSLYMRSLDPLINCKLMKFSTSSFPSFRTKHQEVD
jgi:hypothetical protein